MVNEEEEEDFDRLFGNDNSNLMKSHSKDLLAPTVSGYGSWVPEEELGEISEKKSTSRQMSPEEMLASVLNSRKPRLPPNPPKPPHLIESTTPKRKKTITTKDPKEARDSLRESFESPPQPQPNITQSSGSKTGKSPKE